MQNTKFPSFVSISWISRFTLTREPRELTNPLFECDYFHNVDDRAQWNRVTLVGALQWSSNHCNFVFKTMNCESECLISLSKSIRLPWYFSCHSVYLHLNVAPLPFNSLFQIWKFRITFKESMVNVCHYSAIKAPIELRFFFCPIPVLLSKYQRSFTSLTDLWQEIEHFLFLGKGAFSYSQIKWDDSEIENHASKCSCLNFKASVTMKVKEKMIEVQNFVAVAAQNQWTKWVSSFHMAVVLMKFETDIHHCLKLFTITLYYKTQLEQNSEISKQRVMCNVETLITAVSLHQNKLFNLYFLSQCLGI